MASDEKIDGINGIIGLAGIIPTRAKYIGEAFVSATLTSMTLGVTFGMMGAAYLPTGPLIPFLFGSWLGNSFGLWYHYHNGRNDAMRVAKLYPSLLAHTMMTVHDVIVPQAVLAVSEVRLDVENDTEAEIKKEGITMSPATLDVMTPSLDEWISKASYRVMAFAILATQDCRADIEEIESYRRKQLVESYQEKYSFQKSDEG